MLESDSGERTPIPDPTRLTTAQLYREIYNLQDMLTIRLDAMDKAQTIFSENLTRVPTDTDKQITHLKNELEIRLDHRNK
jgi:hypothetical protein